METGKDAGREPDREESGAPPRTKAASRTGTAEAELQDSRARASLALDGQGRAKVETGSGFLDHMLRALARTSGLDLELKLSGSPLFLAEAAGQALGAALDASLGSRSDIRRYASASVPMDEALGTVALDLSGRPYLVMQGCYAGERIADLEVRQIRALLESLADAGRLTLNVKFEGENDHHMAESFFKALGLALGEAVEGRAGGILSTKGLI
ncbi:MAG: imidazoleglycerol-phosphate dehydratase [Methanosarcinales archaeon]|nr:imidazoleglycerol-phosphate dehydratase [Methanosarcinales archaeon]